MIGLQEYVASIKCYEDKVRRVLDSDSKEKFKKNDYYLTGKLLVAMPYMEDSRFAHAVIYIYVYDDELQKAYTPNSALEQPCMRPGRLIEGEIYYLNMQNVEILMKFLKALLIL